MSAELLDPEEERRGTLTWGTPGRQHTNVGWFHLASVTSTAIHQRNVGARRCYYVCDISNVIEFVPYIKPKRVKS